jgi:hypothetical protein
MQSSQHQNSIKPRGIRIEVTEDDVLTANVFIPYFVVKMGLKFGQMTDKAKKKGRAENELEYLRDIDLNAILEALRTGELTLPCLLMEVDERDKNQHVKITLE